MNRPLHLPAQYRYRPAHHEFLGQSAIPAGEACPPRPGSNSHYFVASLPHYNDFSKSFPCHSYKIFHSPYPASPLFATLTKTAGVSFFASHSETRHPPLVYVGPVGVTRTLQHDSACHQSHACPGLDERTSRRSQSPLSPFLSYSYKLFGTSKNANSPLFSYFQTLWQKRGGWGEGAGSPACSTPFATKPFRNPSDRHRSPLPPKACARLNVGALLNYASGWRIGRILGIPIYLHASWVLVFALITYSLKMGLAERHPSWTLREQWMVGVLTSLLFFCSVLFHELSHSVVAQHYKIRVVSITLFLFGGLARIGREPPKAIQEFNIAVAGPLASFFLYGVFLSITIFFPGNEMLGALAGWLSYINLRLAVFNLLPGFPLDGGRIFRAIVWHYTKDFPRATRIAGASGRLVAYGVMLYGASFAIKGDWASGAWLAFIGWFLLDAARESVAQVDIQETLAGLRATDVMSHEV